MHSFGFYEGTVRALVLVFKYGKVETLAAPLSEMLARALPRERRFDVIVPMPMHKRRQRDRGFNQAELLARHLSRRSGIPCVLAAKRSKNTTPQAGLTSHKRRTNVQGAFEALRPEAIRGKSVLLIDDVLTTGATASACGSVLRRNGAASVTVLTVARADRRMFSDAAVSQQKQVLESINQLESVADGKSGSLA